MECTCNGTGFVPFEKDGYTFAKPCVCREKMLTEARLKASGISEAFQRRSLEQFDTKSNQILKVAKEKAHEYIGSFLEVEKQMNNSIMFLGVPGSGKTHLSLAIANKLLNEYGIGCLYMPYRETMTELKQLSMSDKYKYESKMYKLTTARLLIIDDLFKGTVTEADLNYIFQIINQRYLNQLPFICSSEKNPKQLIEYDEAIGSRMLEQAKGRIIHMNDSNLNHRLYG